MIRRKAQRSPVGNRTQGLTNSSRTLKPLSYEATRGTACEFSTFTKLSVLFPTKSSESPWVWWVKACPENLHRWFSVLALPLVVAPPILSNLFYGLHRLSKWCLIFLSLVPKCTWNLTSLAVLTYLAQSCTTPTMLDRTREIGISYKKAPSTPCKMQKWRKFNTRSFTFVDRSWKLIGFGKLFSFLIFLFPFHKVSISNWNFSQCFLR